MYAWNDGTYLAHHGILGQKWGRRRWQYEDGSLTPAGYPHYGYGGPRKAAAKIADRIRNARKTPSYNNTRNTVDPSIQKRYVDVKKIPISKRPISDVERNKYREEMLKRYANSPKKLSKYKKMSDAELEADIRRKQQMKKTIITAAAVVGVSAAIYLACKANAVRNAADNNGSLDYNESLDDLKIVLSKDSTLHRMTAFSDFDMDKVSGPMYVSYKKADVATYMSLLKDWSGTGKRYDVSLKAVSDIVAPSEKMTRKIFDEVLSTDPSFKRQLVQATYEFYKEQGQPHPLSAIKAYVDSMDKDEYFKQAVWSLVRSGSDAQKTMASTYQSKGYSAVIDLFDKGDMADMPLIILDKSVIRKTGETFVTQAMKRDALKIARKDSSISEIRDTADYLLLTGGWKSL